MGFMRNFCITGLLALGQTLPALSQYDHLLITEFVVTPTAGEFIEIYNPTLATIDLSRYYLTDDVTNNNNDYVNVVNGAGALSVANFDFLVKFPEGASIAPGGVKTVAFSGAGFILSYGSAADYEILRDDAGTPDMDAIAVTSNAGLTNGSESIVLFHWDGVSDLVQDVDYVVWGAGAISAAVDKSGLAIDGPDADSEASFYKDDTPIANQTVVNADNDGSSQPHTSGASAARNAPETGETLTGGNGITGHDETSENLSFAGGSWTLNSTPTPGTVPHGLKRPPEDFVATLNGAQEVPPVPTPATGFGAFTLSSAGDSLTFEITVQDLSSAIIAAHFHRAETGVNGPVVRNIAFSGNQAAGIWTSTDAQPLTPFLVAELLAGRIYVNVHTTMHPAGEIRGQLGKEVEEACVTYDFPVAGGAWYLISLPVIPEDASVAALFPEAIAAYGWNYASQNYAPVSELEPENAYWLLLAQPANAEVCGEPLSSYTKNYTQEGWEMIGSVIAPSAVAADPPGILLAMFCWDALAQNYIEIDPPIIEPEDGCWVLLHQTPGTITIGGGGMELSARHGSQKAFGKASGALPPPSPFAFAERELERIPENIGLSQNFPNPFNPETMIEYALPEAGRVSLKIYDLLGREVRTLIDAERPAGLHHAIWDGRDAAGSRADSGVYVCRLQAGGLVQAKKIVLVK